MRKKKVLVHGTQDSINNFLADAVSHDFEILDVLDESKDLPQFVYKLVDGIILTAPSGFLVKYFLKRGVEPHKIILWDAREGWGNFNLPDSDGTQIIYFYGLEFHICNQDDANFFDSIHNQIQANRQVKNWSPQFYPEVLTQIFQKVMSRPLDFNNLQTFTEKLQWIKIYDATPIKSRLADKYAVRSWVAEKIGDEYLIPLLGVWNDFDDINFDALPNQFVLKCNHGSGMNVICRDKKTFDKQRAREKLNAWLAIDFSSVSLELHYTRIDRKIIAEKYIENMRDGVIDYKFHCFDGSPKFIQVIGDRNFAKHTRYQKFCDLDYNDIGAMFEDYPHFPYDVPAPKELEKMKSFAKILSEGFSYVRVDFYEIEGKLLFGEMTFTSDSGYLPHKNAWTYERDSAVGDMLKLPALTPPPKI